jgi:putative membrane protein
MTEDKNTISPETQRTNLSYERTMLGHERTLMAWIRTAISMITFGFTIYKLLEETGKSEAGQQRLLSPRMVGMIMIGIGLLSLILAQIQHHIALKKIKRFYPDVQRSVSSIIAVLILVFGVLMFLGALLRQ